MNIKELSSELKLSYIKENHELLIEEANHTKMDYQEFLKNVLENEVLRRKENGIKRRLRLAKFSNKKYLEDFDCTKYNSDLRTKFKTLEFIKNKENLIFVGTPGSGKSHYSIGL